MFALIFIHFELNSRLFFLELLRKHKPRLKPALARRFMAQNTRAILMNCSKTAQEEKCSKT